MSTYFSPSNRVAAVVNLGPQIGAQAGLEFGNRDHVRPGAAVENGANARSVDPGDTSNLTHAAGADSGTEIKHEQARDLRNRVVAPRRRPADTQLRWGDTRWARAHAESLAPAIGTFSNSPVSVVAGLLVGCSYSQLSEGVRNAMATYRPRSAFAEWGAIKAFALDSCSLAAPATAYTAKTLLTVTVPFITWCVTEKGWPLQADVIFSRQAIDLYSTDIRSGRSEGTRRNYRAMLMRVSEAVAPEEHPETMTPLPRKRIAAPYTDEEVAQFRLWAIGQVTAEKRRRAMLILILCAGAGMKSHDIAGIYPADVTADGHGVMVNVRGTNPRMVPLRREWEDWVVAILEQVPADVPLWGTPNQTRESNLISSFTQYTVGARPRGDRLRATWIVQQLQAGAPIRELTKALGVRKFENLPHYLDYVEPLDTLDFRAALRGEVAL